MKDDESRSGLSGPNSTHEIELLRKSSRSMLRKRAAIAAAASAIPIPAIDLVADASLLVELLPKINKKFGVAQEQLEALPPEIQSILPGLIMSLGPSLIGQIITKEAVVMIAKLVSVRVTAKQAAKYAPVVGSALAAGLGYAAFMYLGKRHIDQCAKVRAAILKKSRT